MVHLFFILVDVYFSWVSKVFLFVIYYFHLSFLFVLAKTGSRKVIQLHQTQIHTSHSLQPLTPGIKMSHSRQNISRQMNLPQNYSGFCFEASNEHSSMSVQSFRRSFQLEAAANRNDFSQVQS